MTQTNIIHHLLDTCRTVAVLGLSPKPHRASFEVAQYMQTHGWRIIPVNPVVAASGKPILGEKVYTSLTEAARHEQIDLVNVFRNAANVPPMAAEAIAIGARGLWLQLRIAHAEAAAAAQAAGLQVV